MSFFQMKSKRLWMVIPGVFLVSFALMGQFVDPIEVDYDLAVPHEYYPYASINISQQIGVVEDDDHTMSLDNIRSAQAPWKSNDTYDQINRQSHYWIHFSIRSEEQDTLLVEFGHERLATWGNVDFYVLREDSLVKASHTGIQRGVADKDIRSGVNLAFIPIDAGITRVYARLSDYFEITDIPEWADRPDFFKKGIEIFIHDPSTYTTLETYQFPGFFRGPKRGHFFSHNYIKQNLETYTDPTGDMTVQDVSERWDDIAGYHYNHYPHPDSVYWMRMKIAGTEEGSGTYMLGPSSGTQWNFDTTRMYFQTRSGRWYHMITGNKVHRQDQSVRSSWNLFKINIAPNDTAEVYFKMIGAGKRYVPGFSMAHIDESSFWSALFTVQWIHGGFICVLLTATLYFLILGFIEKGAVHNFWFVGWVVGFVLLLGFTGGDVNYFLLPYYEAYHPWITAFGGFLMIVALFQYFTIYLNIDSVFGLKTKQLNLLVALIHGGICIYYAISYQSIAGNVPIYTGYFQLFMTSIAFFFLMAWAIGILELRKGNKLARFFVIAFGSLIVFIIVRIVFIFGSIGGDLVYDQEFITSGLYMHYLLFLGIASTIILMAFGNGYRINQLKLTAAQASFTSEKNLEVARLLREKNEMINKRAEENAMLVKEIHHRVKNNLQVLASLLSLQSDYISEKTAYDAILESKSRVESMGLVHQMLYLGDQGVASVNMPDYISQLIGYFKAGFNGSKSRIQFKHDVQIENLDIDTAIPVALTITELVTNSIKHGFKMDENGEITIRLWINEANQMCLLVKDNGVGIPKNVENLVQPSFGTELIRILSKKLKGAIEVMPDEGYATLIKYDRYIHYRQ